MEATRHPFFSRALLRSILLPPQLPLLPHRRCPFFSHSIHHDATPPVGFPSIEPLAEGAFSSLLAFHAPWRWPGGRNALASSSSAAAARRQRRISLWPKLLLLTCWMLTHTPTLILMGGGACAALIDPFEPRRRVCGDHQSRKQPPLSTTQSAQQQPATRQHVGHAMRARASALFEGCVAPGQEQERGGGFGGLTLWRHGERPHSHALG